MKRAKDGERGKARMERVVGEGKGGGGDRVGGKRERGDEGRTYR